MQRALILAALALLASCGPPPYDAELEAQAKRTIAELVRFEIKYGEPGARGDLIDDYPSAGQWDGRTVRCVAVRQADGSVRRAVMLDGYEQIGEADIGDNRMFNYVWGRAGC